jgi:hypothetical protein
MTIKHLGGIFGRNPTFKDVTIDGGIYFESGQSANFLDDYEEGTWTPTLITDGTDFDSITYDGATGGVYTKIGNVVTCSGRLRTDAVTIGSAAGNVCIGGLPFVSSSAQAGRSSGSVSFVSDWAGDMPMAIRTDNGESRAVLYYRTSSNGEALSIQPSDVGTGGNDNHIFFSLFYYA